MYGILQTANAGRLFVFSPTGKHANVLPILHEPEKERKKKRNSFRSGLAQSSCFYFNFINKRNETRKSDHSVNAWERVMHSGRQAVCTKCKYKIDK